MFKGWLLTLLVFLFVEFEVLILVLVLVRVFDLVYLGVYCVCWFAVCLLTFDIGEGGFLCFWVCVMIAGFVRGLLPV